MFRMSFPVLAAGRSSIAGMVGFWYTNLHRAGPPGVKEMYAFKHGQPDGLLA